MLSLVPRKASTQKQRLGASKSRKEVAPMEISNDGNEHEAQANGQDSAEKSDNTIDGKSNADFRKLFLAGRQSQ
jgi:hypothetical protein